LYVAMTRARDRLIMTYTARNLEADLQDIALRMDFDEGAMLCQDVVCPGEWVLLAAMQHMEAGALHALGGRPERLTLGDHPWKICVASAPETTAQGTLSEVQASQMPEGAEAVLKQALSFRYPHIAATKAPSKQTATDRKGRQKDAEAAEHTEEPRGYIRTWRTPTFVSAAVGGKAYGNAIHAAMQYVRYENCGGEEDVRQEIQHLTEEGFLSEEQGKLVNCSMIAHFFETEIGRKLRSGIPHLREFKFSILDDGSHYAEDLAGEQVLLQGVVDCALLEEDGITIVDFKTDRVTEETAPMVAERYAPQVETYAEALCRIYEMPVKAKYLYLFRLNRLWKL